MLGRCALLAARRASASGNARAQVFQAARAFATEEAKKGGGGAVKLLLVGAAAAGGVYACQNGLLGALSGSPGPVISVSAPTEKDYAAVRKAIEDIMDVEGYDDGSYGPVLVRLAWHSAGTYDKNTGTGGSNGATMRFAPESEHGANAGLHVARALLEPIKAKFPWISYADLYTLAGATAIEAMGGPAIPWKPGRSDAKDASACPPDGRLPDASLGAAHIRDIFGRMGFSDRDMVALSGAHTLGRCHKDRSGFEGPWTNAPTTFSNLYFKELTENKWRKKRWDGPVQYEDSSRTLMMLPTDMALVWDRRFKPVVDEYAKDEEAFFKDFASAFGKLLALGVPGQNPA